MIRKKNSIVIQQSRSITSFFNRNLEIFERPFDGTPAAIDPPSRVFAVEQSSSETPALDISGYLTSNAPPCPPVVPGDDCYTESTNEGCIETFSRIESNGWGTSEFERTTGTTYLWQSGGSHQSVDGSWGIISPSGGGPTITFTGSPSPISNPSELLVLARVRMVIGTGLGSGVGSGSLAFRMVGSAGADQYSVEVGVFAQQGVATGGNAVVEAFLGINYDGAQEESDTWELSNVPGIPDGDLYEFDVSIRLRNDGVLVSGKAWETNGSGEPLAYNATFDAPPVVLNTLNPQRTGGTAQWFNSIEWVDGFDCGTEGGCDEFSSGSTVEGSMIYVTGTSYRTPTSANYITNVWVNGLSAVRDIDYVETDDGVQFNSSLDADAIVKARYVQL